MQLIHFCAVISQKKSERKKERKKETYTMPNRRKLKKVLYRNIPYRWIVSRTYRSVSRANSSNCYYDPIMAIFIVMLSMSSIYAIVQL